MRKSIWAQPSLSRDFALLSGLIILVSVLVSVRVAYTTYTDYSEKALSQLQNEAARLDRTLTLEMQNASYLLEAISRQISEYGAPDLPYITKMFRSFGTAVTSVHNFSWIDTSERVVISSGKGILDRPVNVEDRDYLKKSLAEPWKVQMGRPIEGRISGKWVIPLSLGLTDDTGKYLGTLLISVSVSDLTQKMESLLDKNVLSFGLLTPSFQKVIQVSHDPAFIEHYFPKEQLALLNFEERPRGVFSQANPFDPSSIYAYYARSKQYPFVFVLGHDSRFSTNTLMALFWPRLLQLLIMAVFLVSLLWVIRLRIIRPVIELSEGAARIARGEPYTPLPKSGPGEIEALSAQLGKISDYLRERRLMEEELRHKALQFRRAKETAELTNRIKIDFLSSMSHELRTPLNNIVGFSEVMRNQVYGPVGSSTYVQYTEDIYQSAQRLLEIINDVVALSKAETGIAETRERPVRVGTLLHKCLRLMQEKLKERELNVHIETPENLPRLVIDELRFKQIILNLLTNAMRYTPAGKDIAIRVKLEQLKKSKQLAISISDGGELVISSAAPPKEKPREHGMAFAKTKVSVAEFGGMSISLARTLAAMCSGMLDFTAIPGEGNVVTLRFPSEKLVFGDTV